MLVRSAALLAFALFLAPLAAALPAAPDPTAGVVVGHSGYNYVTHEYCSSYDGYTALVSSDLTSRMSTAAVGGGITAFTVHLDATVADPTTGSSACPAMDFTITSALPWPPVQPQAYAQFSSSCGMYGYLESYTYGAQTIRMIFTNAPAACGVHFQNTAEIDWTMSSPHPSTALVCTPLVASTCVGAYAESYPGYGCGGGDAERLYVTAGLTIAYVERSCHWWQDGREHVSVQDGFSIVTVDTTSDSCDVIVSDPIGLVGPNSAPCPEEVRAFVYDTDWANVLP